MGNKKKKTSFPENLWAVEHIDRFNWDDSFMGKATAKEMAEAEYNRLTCNGTKNTESDKLCLSYYKLRQVK